MLTNRFAIVVSLAFGICVPALATDFYLVQDSASGRCRVVENRSNDRDTIPVGDGEVYPRKEEAEIAMKKLFVCISAPTDIPPPVQAPMNVESPASINQSPASATSR